MAGGTLAHAQLGLAVGAILRQALGHCRVFSSDAAVRVDATNLSTFPDGSVVCGDIERSTIDANAVVNPSIIFEVTSKSTEDYDRGDKLSHYKQLRSLRAVLFVSHRINAITIVERTATGWTERDVRSGELVQLREPSVSFKVDDVYAGVELEAG
jgi:Uma2 family endonuclease